MIRPYCWSVPSVFVCAFLAIGADLYPVRVGSDHRHLIDQKGAPFLVQGDAPWSLISGLTREEAEMYLEHRRRQGFNSIIVNLIEHKFRGPVNRYGQGPFMTPGDFSQPNDKYFDRPAARPGSPRSLRSRPARSGRVSTSRCAACERRSTPMPGSPGGR